MTTKERFPLLCARGALGLVVLVSAACSGNTVGEIRYRGMPLDTMPGTVGQKADVIINSQNGGVFVDTAAGSGTVGVSAVPFAIASADAAGASAAAAAMSQATLTFSPAANSAIQVDSTGGDDYGLDLVVHLPSPFHGKLLVNAQHGNVTYLASAAAPGATINVGVGDIDVENAGNQLIIQGGVSNIVFVTAGTVGDADTGTSSIKTNEGNITARIPDASSLTIHAWTGGDGIVRPEANQVATLAPGDQDAQIIVGDGMSGTLDVATGKGDIFFLRP